MNDRRADTVNAHTEFDSVRLPAVPRDVEERISGEFAIGGSNSIQYYTRSDESR